MGVLLKIGEKGRHLEIPDGWRKLEQDEIVKKGDKIANVRDICWMNAEADEDIGNPANWCDHAIREKSTEIKFVK